MSLAFAYVRDHPLLSPLLVIYASFTVLAAIFEFGPLLAPINLVLLVVYISAIHLLTSEKPAAEKPPRRRRDIGLAITVAVLQLAAATVAWFVVIAHGWPAAWAAHLRAAGVPSLIAGKAANAAMTVPLLLLPTAVAVAAFRVSARDVGLAASPRNLLLGVLLAAVGMGVGAGDVALGGKPALLWAQPLPAVAATIAIQSLSNGIPEELAFRGVVFGRLMPWLGRPGNALAISTMVWGLFHVPSLVAGSGIPFWLALPIGLFGTLPGLVYGFLFYRTRSIWPGAIWHTSTTGLGLLFVG